MTLNARLAIALLACCTSAQAQGQTVWRCGPDGRVFSDTPCAEGRLVATVDPRPAADVHAARDMARREQRLADRLREERLQREAVGPVRAWRASAPSKSGSSRWRGRHRTSTIGCRSTLQTKILGPQLFRRLEKGGVDRDAVHRTELNALRLVEVAHAFCAALGVDLVDFCAPMLMA
jgi:hypothetical protein